MAATGDDDEGDERGPYSHMSDMDFIEELRRHLVDESWTLNHWLELELRGMEILKDDPELLAAMTAQMDRTSSAMREKLAPMIERYSELFRDAFSDLSLPRFEFDLPELDLSELVLPNIDIDTDSVLDRQDTVARLAGIQKDQWEREAEIRQALLDTAGAAAKQVELLEEIERCNQERHEQVRDGYEKITAEVRTGHQPRWVMWVTLAFTAIAAVAAIVSVCANVVRC